MPTGWLPAHRCGTYGRYDGLFFRIVYSMKKKRNLRKRIGRILELPQDLDPHLVQITWIGRSTVLIEQHRGIVGLETNEIRLLTEQGTVLIRGSAMRLLELSNARAYLEGDLVGIFFEDKS